jgi:type IV pilus assembly protein PilA
MQGKTNLWLVDWYQRFANLEIIMIKSQSTFSTPKGFTLLELMIVIAILAILSAIAIPNFISLRNKGYCTEAEKDADNVASAIIDYFGIGARTQTPSMDDLNVSIANLVEIEGIDPNILITVRVTDRTRRCPLDYQDAHGMWDSNYVFTKTIE